jgi:hypothetical protein
MIINTLAGEPMRPPKTLAQQEVEFAAEGAPPPGHISGTDVPRAPNGIDVLPPPTASIYIDEWDMLMMAVQERLRLTVGAAPQQGDDGVSQPLRACVLECVHALQQLHGLLLHASPRPTSAEAEHPSC